MPGRKKAKRTTKRTPKGKARPKKATSTKRTTAKKPTATKRKATKKAPSRSPAGMSQTALADLFNVTTRTVQRWVELGLPQVGSGRTARYDPRAAIAWVRDRDRAEARDASKPKDLEEARTRKAAAEAELAEFELGERRKELMTLQQYREVVGDAFGRVRAQLLALEMKLAPELIGLKTIPEARAVLKRAVGELFEELYDANDVPAAGDEPAE